MQKKREKKKKKFWYPLLTHCGPGGGQDDRPGQVRPDRDGRASWGPHQARQGAGAATEEIAGQQTGPDCDENLLLDTL